MAGGSFGTVSIEVLANIANMVTNLEKGQAETNKFAENVKESIEGVNEAFKELAKFAGIALGAEAFKEIIAGSLEAAEQVTNMSKAFGFTTQTIQTMGFAAAMVGGNLEMATAAMSHLEKSAEQAAAGNTQAAEAFRAIGINATQLTELLKNPDELLQTVAEHMAEFGAGSGKTAAAMQIFGRGAAQIIPLLEELGENFDALKKRAQDFGVVLSSQDQSAMLDANEKFDLLKEAATGAGNQLTVALLPAINAVADALLSIAESGVVTDFFHSLGQNVGETIEILTRAKEQVGELLSSFGAVSVKNPFEGMQMDAAGMVADFMTDIDRILTGFKNMGPEIGAALEVTWAGLKNGFGEVVAWIEGQLASLAGKEADLLSKVPFAGGAVTELNRLSASLQQASLSFEPVTANIEKFSNQVLLNKLDLAIAKKENDDWAASVRSTADALNVFTTGMDAFQSSLVKGDVAGNLAKLKAAQDNIHDTAKEMIADGDNEARVNAAAASSIGTLTKMVQQANAAQVSYNASVKAGKDFTEEAAKGLESLQATVTKLTEVAGDDASKAWTTYVGAIQKLDEEYAKAILNTGNLAQAQLLLKAGIDGVTATYQRNLAIAQSLALVKQDEGTKVQQLIGQYQQEDAALSQNATERERVTAEISAHKAMLEAIQATIKAGHPLTQQEIDDLFALAKAHADETVAAKANEEALKQWQSIASSGFDSVANSIAGFATGSIKSWHDLGQSLIDDTKQFIAAIIAEFLKLEVFNGIINSLFGSNLPTGLASLAGGGGSGGGLSSLLGGGGNGGGITSLLGGNSGGLSGSGSIPGGGSYTLGAVNTYGGIGSGFGYTSGMGSALGAAGALFAGYNEFKAAGGGVGGLAGGAAYGIGTYALGGAISAGVAGAAAGGISAGLAAGFAAIPVVGWIALGAMAINAISGGKLFGTSAKPYGSEENLTVGPGGATIGAAIDEKGQKAFFGGSYYKQVSQPVDQATQDSVAAFYASLQQAATQEAAAFGQSTATIVTGSFHETFDKAGKMLTQTSTVLGQTFTESIQDFQTRMVADTLLANMGAASAEAQQIAQKWQKTATDLLAGAQFLAQAESDISQGHSLIGGDTSLADIDKEVEKLAVSGESLIQTYARLGAEETDLSNTLALLGMSTEKTGTDFLEFADSLAQAAGGLQNLDALWSDYYSNYYSQAEQQANTLKALQTNVTSTFAAIGEDPTESMAQFRQDFEAAMPTLTPDQVIQWLMAGDALAKLDTYIGQVGDSAQTATKSAADMVKATDTYNTFIEGFKQALNPLDDFEAAMVKLGGTLADNINQANQLAIAAGMSGASLTDLGTILQASVAAGVAQMRQEEASAQALVDKLFGTSIDKLNAQLTAEQKQLAGVDQNQFGAYQLEAFYQGQIDATQAQIDAANKKAQDAQNMSDAQSLVAIWGDLSAVTGQTLDGYLSKYGIDKSQLEGYLGVDDAGLQKLFNSDEANAAAQLAIQNNTDLTQEYLADIKAILNGQPEPFTPKDFNEVLNGQNFTPNPGLPGRGQRGNDENVVRLHPEDRALLESINLHSARTATSNEDMVATERGRRVQPPNSVVVARGRVGA